MKRLTIILLLASSLFASCGIANKTTSTTEKSIPTTFFNCFLGNSESLVRNTMDRQDYFVNWQTIPLYKLSPLGNRRIKSQQTYSRIAYGGYTWQDASFLFDFRERFFSIAFLQDFSDPDDARTRYNEIKSTLDGKYGVGHDSQYGVVYGDLEGMCIRLAVVPVTGKDGVVLGLYYTNEQIYRIDTAAAIDEL